MREIVSLLLAAVLCVAGFFPARSLAQEVERPARKHTPAPVQDLDRVFRNYERLRLDTAEAAREIRLTGRLSIHTERQSLELDLEPHDLRAEGYRAEETTGGGIRLPVVNDSPIRTFKGRVLGNDDAQARFTIDEDSFEGSILTADERYYVEPARRYLPSAEPSEFLFYKASDVIETEPLTCGLSLHEKVSEAADQLGDVKSIQSATQGAVTVTPDALATPLEAELATEADFEYVTALGGAAAANNEILSIMNQVEGIYQTEIGLSFKIVYQHTWATSADPYTTVDPVLAIKEFTNYWNANFANVVRDVAHMWTGKNLTNTAGVGWTGVVCKSPASAYSLSERVIPAPQKFVLPAHEIGHNFNASHTDGTAGCANTIMQSVATDTSVLTFCQTSRDQITSFINANSSCLSAAPVCTFSISPTSASFPSGGGTGTVAVTTTAGCAWTAQSNVTWITVTAGASGSGNGTVSYTVAANTATTSRTGTLTIAGRTFTVTQAAAPPTCTFTISPASASFPSGGGTGSIAVTTPAGCAWTARSNVTWITVTAGASGSGNGTVGYSVAANTTTAARTGTLTVAGKTFTVTQAAAATGPTLSSLTLSPTIVAGCKGVTGTVQISAPAPASGAVVTLTDTLAATTLPASVTIAAGTTSKTFTITTVPVSADQTGTVTAKLGAVTKTATLTVRRIGVLSVTAGPNPIIGGDAVMGRVTLECAAGPGGITVTLSDNVAATTFPASIVVPAGATSQAFQITTVAVAARQSGTLTATANGISKSVAVSVRPIGVLSLTLSPNPVVGGGINVTGTVTLERSAAPGNIVVSLTSSNTAIAAPTVTSITILAGARNKSFTIRTAQVSSTTTVVITATANGVGKSATLTVNPGGG
ncbi:MAG TPA: M12 family metallo-peptidase [Pyrinomonadaceae bacterium]|jgi:hypothetical protein